MNRVFAALFAAVIAGPALAHDGVHVENAYARVAMENAPTAAVFMELVNHAAEDDRLLSAASDVAEVVELHTHVMSAEGMMQMLPVEEGFVVPAGGAHALARGGDHVMLMGLTGPLAEGDKFTLTLTFERSGKVVVVVPVRNDDPAGAEHSGHGDHSGHTTAPAND
jgi:periplasmic copper chaperone A